MPELRKEEVTGETARGRSRACGVGQREAGGQRPPTEVSLAACQGSEAGWLVGDSRTRVAVLTDVQGTLIEKLGVAPYPEIPND